MRLLEEAAIQTCGRFGVATLRDPSATGVWTVRDGKPFAKIAAMGVRVRRWVSMHGLALNVESNLDHFNLIVPCGLVGRPVTSLRKELGDRAPTFAEVREQFVPMFVDLLDEAMATAKARRTAPRHAEQ